MDYYIMYNGQQQGPMPKEQLANYGLQPNSMVWAQGMANWQPASQVPDLADALAAAQGQPLPPPANVGNWPGNAQGNQPPQFPQGPVEDLKTQAIIATVVGFLFSCIGLIFGVIAITKANAAQNLARQGMTAQAIVSNKTARTMIILAYIFAAVGVVAGLLGVFA